ncbi:hypothetical protein EI94DRAFT_563114 [Lactarius quietus]|nr:hypothetical protein EI94DRAFT_563114 [Lactarius quietus]
MPQPLPILLALIDGSMAGELIPATKHWHQLDLYPLEPEPDSEPVQRIPGYGASVLSYLTFQRLGQVIFRAIGQSSVTVNCSVHYDAASDHTTLEDADYIIFNYYGRASARVPCY